MGPAPARPPGGGTLAPNPELAYHQDNEAYKVDDAYPAAGSTLGVPQLPCFLSPPFFSFPVLFSFLYRTSYLEHVAQTLEEHAH